VRNHCQLGARLLTLIHHSLKVSGLAAIKEAQYTTNQPSVFALRKSESQMSKVSQKTAI